MPMGNLHRVMMRLLVSSCHGMLQARILQLILEQKSSSPLSRRHDPQWTLNGLKRHVIDTLVGPSRRIKVELCSESKKHPSSAPEAFKKLCNFDANHGTSSKESRVGRLPTWCMRHGPLVQRVCGTKWTPRSGKDLL